MPNQLRGFAALDPVAISELARKGGVSSQAQGKSYRFAQEDVKKMGSLGGRQANQNRIAKMIELMRCVGAVPASCC